MKIVERTVDVDVCADCGREYEHVFGAIGETPDDVRAVYHANIHGHPEHEASVDVLLWEADELITFSCRMTKEGAMALDAPLAHRPRESEEFTRRQLSREQALAHPFAAFFWKVVDVLYVDDPAVTTAIYSGTHPE